MNTTQKKRKKEKQKKDFTHTHTHTHTHMGLSVRIGPAQREMRLPVTFCARPFPKGQRDQRPRASARGTNAMTNAECEEEEDEDKR